LKNAEISTDATIMRTILQYVRGKEYSEDQRVEGKMIKKNGSSRDTMERVSTDLTRDMDK